MGPERDPHLSLTAVGLWHRMPAGDVPLEPFELLTLAGAVEPHQPIDDVPRALDELLTTGWVVELGGAYIAVEPE